MTSKEPEEAATWGEPHSSDLYCEPCALASGVGQTDHNTPAHGKDRPAKRSGDAKK